MCTLNGHHKIDRGADQVPPGTLCGAPCANQIQFDSSKSSTFVDGGETDSIIFGTGVGVDPVIGDDWMLTLRSAKDTVSIGNLKVPNVDLFLITDQTPTFGPDPFSGIQGKSAAVVFTLEADLSRRNVLYCRWSL